MAETFIVARTPDLNLRGWVYYELFSKTRLPEDFGLMSSLDQSDPPRLKQVVERNVKINIAPASQATKTDMLGTGTTTLQADASGNVTVRSTSSPVYVKVD
ncbi:MAG: hypothetical protein AB1714_07830 [Acidobacteriota bacterium]